MSSSVKNNEPQKKGELTVWRQAPKASHYVPLERARVKSLVADTETTNSHSEAREERILERIQKCLDRGKHPNTPESEARSSLKMAAKLMAEHNVTEAEMEFKFETSKSSGRQGGMSVVKITHRNVSLGKKPTIQAFSGSLGQAIEIFFDCHFYGISKNTIAAAMAFEMLFNLISYWALAKKGGPERRSYCMGVAEGLRLLALEEKAAFEAARKAEASTQLVLFDGKQIAKDYMKELGIKSRTGRRIAAVRDSAAYADGKDDGKNINVRGKRLRCGTFKEPA